MDIDMVNRVLSPGKIVKNYKEMCLLLDEKIKTGEAKQRQLKDWQRYFKFEKSGHKFVITEVLDIPEEKVDGRSKGNHMLFASEIAEIILQIATPTVPRLLGEEEGVAISKNQWIRRIGLANSEYGKRRDIKTEVPLSYTPASFENFYYFGAGAAVENYLDSAMNHLEKNKMAKIQKFYTAVSKFSSDSMEFLEEEWSSDDELIQSTDEFVYTELEKLGYDITDSAVDTVIPELRLKAWHKYLDSQPEDVSNQIKISLSLDEYKKMIDEYCKKCRLDSTSFRDRKKAFNGILKENHWKRCYLTYSVVPIVEPAPIDRISAYKKRQMLNEKVCLHLIDLTKEHYRKKYDEWQEEIQKEVLNGHMKIGVMRPHQTEAYKAQVVTLDVVNLTERLNLIEALIKLPHPTKNVGLKSS